MAPILLLFWATGRSPARCVITLNFDKTGAFEAPEIGRILVSNVIYVGARQRRKPRQKLNVPPCEGGRKV
jgi:hypothetical protein